MARQGRAAACNAWAASEPARSLDDELLESLGADAIYSARGFMLALSYVMGMAIVYTAAGVAAADAVRQARDCLGRFAFAVKIDAR